jgi:hypothetical protein
MGSISSLYGGLDRTAGNPARPKPHLNSYSIGVRFGVGVVAESNDQGASDAAVRAVTPGARSQANPAARSRLTAETPWAGTRSTPSVRSLLLLVFAGS